MTRLIAAAMAVGLVLLAAGFAVIWYSPSAQDAMFRRVVQANLVFNDAVLDPDALHVVLCGTGSPMPDPDRAQSCAIVYAGKHVL